MRFLIQTGFSTQYNITLIWFYYYYYSKSLILNIHLLYSHLSTGGATPHKMEHNQLRVIWVQRALLWDRWLWCQLTSYIPLLFITELPIHLFIRIAQSAQRKASRDPSAAVFQSTHNLVEAVGLEKAELEWQLCGTYDLREWIMLKSDAKTEAVMTKEHTSVVTVR